MYAKDLIANALQEQEQAWERLVQAIEARAQPIIDELLVPDLRHIAQAECGIDYDALTADQQSDFLEEFRNFVARQQAQYMTLYKQRCGLKEIPEIVDEITDLLKADNPSGAIKRLLQHAAAIEGFYQSQTFVAILVELDVGMFNDLVLEGMQKDQARDLIDAMYLMVGQTNMGAVVDAAYNCATSGIIDQALRQHAAAMREHEKSWLDQGHLDAVARHMREFSERQWGAAV
ncbi:hypothetical protein GC177_07730 [bacterium]|nr:hypothetical protein [bacterium]